MKSNVKDNFWNRSWSHFLSSRVNLFVYISFWVLCLQGREGSTGSRPWELERQWQEVALNYWGPGSWLDAWRSPSCSDTGSSAEIISYKLLIIIHYWKYLCYTVFFVQNISESYRGGRRNIMRYRHTLKICRFRIPPRALEGALFDNFRYTRCQIRRCSKWLPAIG